MFNLKEFIKENIVNGVKNDTFSKEYGNILAVNYLTKGVLVIEDVSEIDTQITEWETSKSVTVEEETQLEDVEEVIDETQTEDIEEIPEETPEEVTEETTEESAEE